MKDGLPPALEGRRRLRPQYREPQPRFVDGLQASPVPWRHEDRVCLQL